MASAESWVHFHGDDHPTVDVSYLKDVDRYTLRIGSKIPETDVSDTLMTIFMDRKMLVSLLELMERELRALTDPEV